MRNEAITKGLNKIEITIASNGAGNHSARP